MFHCGTPRATSALSSQTQIRFNQAVVSALNAPSAAQGSLLRLSEDTVQKLNSAASYVCKQLPKHQLLAIEALIITEVHNRDIVMALLDNRVTKVTDFEWTK